MAIGIYPILPSVFILRPLVADKGLAVRTASDSKGRQGQTPQKITNGALWPLRQRASPHRVALSPFGASRCVVVPVVIAV